MDTESDFELAAASRFPDGLNATETGSTPVAVGEPGAGEREPPFSTLNTDTECAYSLATASRSPDGLNATETGRFPVVVGEPGAGLRDPPVPAVAGAAPTAIPVTRRLAAPSRVRIRRRRPCLGRRPAMTGLHGT
jgi:hypothetical protein